MSERAYFRHHLTGDRGYLIDEDTMCLDRVPPVEIVYRESDWHPEPEAVPLSDRQIGQIAFAADRQLCRALGLMNKARREWTSLSEDEQIGYSAKGPGEPEVRKELFRAIRKALKDRPCR